MLYGPNLVKTSVFTKFRTFVGKGLSIRPVKPVKQWFCTVLP